MSASSVTSAPSRRIPLVEPPKMWRGEGADTKTRRTVDGFQQCDTRTLAVGSADGHDAVGGRLQREGCEDPLDPLEAQIDLLRVQRLQPPEPVRPPWMTVAGSSRLRRAVVGPATSRAARRSRHGRGGGRRSCQAPPFSNRNSALWKPSGSVSPTVCSMTRGPAKTDERLRFRRC